MKKRATIQDVAAHAGVSMMTVSRVLNQESHVSPKTREKVLNSVELLSYRPNVSARRLASSKSYFLGMLYDNPSAGYVSQFLLGALKRSRACGYHLVVESCEGELSDTLETVQSMIAETKVDGVILLPPVCDLPEVIDALNEAGVPCVRISPDTDLTSSPYVCMDDYQAAFDVTSGLIEDGHTKIGFIIGHPNQGASRLRYQGYLDALRSHKVNSPPEYIEQGYFTYKSGLKAAQTLLSLEDRPTAIFGSNDDMAAAVVSAAHMLKIEVPEDLSVVGFDDTQIATTIWPQLTTVRQPIKEMAESAIDIFASGEYSKSSPIRKSDYRRVLDFKIIARESTQPYKK